MFWVACILVNVKNVEFVYAMKAMWISIIAIIHQNVTCFSS